MIARIATWVIVFLLNAAWQAVIVAVMASAADRLLRKAPVRYRHLLWVAALVAAIAISFGSALRVAEPAPQSHMFAAQAESASVLVPLGSPKHAVSKSRQRSEIPTLQIAGRIALLLSAIYALLVFIRFAALVCAWFRTQRMIRQAESIELPACMAAALGLCQARLGTKRVRVLASDVLAPMTAGAMRPVVILPRALLAASDRELATSALGHELAHVVRRDYLFNLVYELLALPLWFHPALALMRKRIRETRELRCDEIVTERLQDAHVYARSLLELAGAALPFGRPAATITVGIADADILEERVTTLLNRSKARKHTLLIIAAALLFAGPCIAAAGVVLRVNVQSPETPSTSEQTNAVHDFIGQHRVGDTVRGKVLKMGATRAVIQLAPGVTSVMRIPAYVSDPMEVGAERNFTIMRLNPEAGLIGLADPAAPSQSERNVITRGGPTNGIGGGVNGGVLTGVSGGVLGGVGGEPKVALVVGDAPGTEPLDKRAFMADEAIERANAVLAGSQSEQEITAQAKVAREMAERIERGEKVKEEGSLSAEERAARIAKMKEEGGAERKEAAQTAREAKITMEQAIQIAKAQQGGTVIDSRLTRERGQATYIIAILSGDENNPATTRFLISAIDGSVMDTFHQQPE
jgi:beta-lactamase regulating signal transducer with metallopeptidase domain/uncharacterized membrane protein YkoI